MRVWRALVLVNLALAAGLSVGYALWGRHLAALETDMRALQEEADRLQQERDALAAGAASGVRQWEGRGVVRGAYPRLIVITHEEIAGGLPARTTGFRLGDAAGAVDAQVGEPIRFWLQGEAADDAAVVRVEPW